MTTTATTQSRIARLEESSHDDYDHVVHGVAHGEEEFTRGLNSPKYWPAAELEKAAPTLEGQPIFKDHGDGDREDVGAVLRSAYEPGLGVVYEAGLTDAEVAEELSSGQREVSIEAGNPSGVDKHDETGAVIMRDYKYTALTTPKKGASEANYTAPGPAQGNPAVAALSAGAIETVLDGDDVDLEAELNAYQTVGGVRFRGTRDGKLDKDALPNTDGDYEQHYLFDADTASASSYPVVDTDGYLRRGNVAAAYSVGPRGGVAREELYDKLRPLNDAFTTPPIEPEKLESDQQAAMVAGDLAADAGALQAALADMPPKLDDAAAGLAVGDDPWSADVRLFRVVAPKDSRDEFDDPVLGVGVRFPESGVYVDWHTAAFPDELDEPHVSEYGSVADLVKATGNQIVDFTRPPGVRASSTSADLESDDPTGASPSGSDTNSEDSMTDPDNDPNIEALLERVDEKDEQIDSLEAELEEKHETLDEKEARIAELEEETDDRISELEDENEELREQNEAAREQYAAALAQADTVFDEEELAENYSLAELAAKVEEADFSDSNGTTEPFIRSGGGSGTEANLSSAEQERKQELEAKLSDLEDTDGFLAEKERDRVEAELAELTGGEA